MARTLKELAKEAILVQDACNLSGVAHGFSRAMSDLCEHVKNTDERNRHPIAVLWADKIASLAGDGVNVAWDEVAKLAAIDDDLVVDEPCSECGFIIPPNTDSVINDHHSESCSAHPSNVSNRD